MVRRMEMSKGRISDMERARRLLIARRLLEKGMSTKEAMETICRELGCHKDTAYRYIRAVKDIKANEEESSESESTGWKFSLYTKTKRRSASTSLEMILKTSLKSTPFAVSLKKVWIGLPYSRPVN